MFGIAFMGLGCAIALIGIGLVGYGLYSYQTDKTKRESLPSATGIVMELVRRVGYRSAVYHPVVEFKSPNGAMLRFESKYGSMPASQKVGDAVQVRYNPTNPNEAEIDSPVSRWLGLGIAGFMGVIAACLGLAFLGLGVLSFMFGI